MNDALSEADLREILTPEEYAKAVAPLVEPGGQGSPEWLKERCGHVTCSRFVDVLDFTKASKEGAKRAAYRKEVAIERITGQWIEHYVSRPMRDGIEREPDAKMAYEARTGRLLLDSGFRKHPTLAWVGGSPDALIVPGGGIEIKCPLPTTHVDTLVDGMDPDHLPQVQGLMWLHDAQWWDFCSYCPVFEEPLRTYIQRIPRDDAYIAALETSVRTFLAEVAALVERLTRKSADR